MSCDQGQAEGPAHFSSCNLCDPGIELLPATLSFSLFGRRWLKAWFTITTPDQRSVKVYVRGGLEIWKERERICGRGAISFPARAAALTIETSTREKTIDQRPLPSAGCDAVRVVVGIWAGHLSRLWLRPRNYNSWNSITTPKAHPSLTHNTSFINF